MLNPYGIVRDEVEMISMIEGLSSLRIGMALIATTFLLVSLSGMTPTDVGTK